MSTPEDKKIADLIFRHLTGRLNRKLKKELEAWRAASAANELLFTKLTDRTYLLEVIRDFYSIRAAWKKLVEKAPELRD